MTRLIVAVFGGAVAWSLHLVLSYLVVGLACRPSEPVLPAGGGLITAILLALSIATAAATVGAAIIAARIWRDGDGDDDGEAGRSRGRRGLGFVGLLLNLVFLVTIVLGASAAFVLPTC